MATAHYNPAQVGAMLGVHGNTIRQWCREFAPFLSAGANPPRGTYRTLNADDVAVLRHVAEMSRVQRLPLPAITAALADMPAADLRAPTIEAPQNAQEGPQRTEGGLMVVPGLDELPARIVAQLQPLLDDAYTRGRAEARRRVPPEYVLIVALVCLVALTIAAMVIMR